MKYDWTEQELSNREGVSSQKQTYKFEQEDPDRRPLRLFNEVEAWIELHGEVHRTETGQGREK